MCKINDISISNYRGIKSLKVEGFRDINIFLGDNNSSKSSLLESILILMGANKLSLPIEMNACRNYNELNKSDIATFFHNMDVKEHISILSNLSDTQKASLDISYFEEQAKVINTETLKLKEVSQLNNYGLEYRYTDGKEKHQARFIFLPEEGKVKIEGGWEKQNGRNAFYIAPRYNFKDFISHFNQIVTDKEKDYVIEALNYIEPRIKDITVVGSQIMVDAGLNKLIPINLMGDGTRKLFTIVTALYQAKGGILLIDEIDNGLYYKSMKALWKSIFSISHKFNIQIFATTHSVDSLNALNALTETEYATMGKEVKIFTLRKDSDDNITSYAFDNKKFNYLLNREEEIR